MYYVDRHGRADGKIVIGTTIDKEHDRRIISKIQPRLRPALRSKKLGDLYSLGFRNTLHQCAGYVQGSFQFEP